MSCGYAQGHHPRLRHGAQPPIAPAVAAFLPRTRRLGCRSFVSCGVFGRRAGGVAPSAGFVPRGHLAFPVSSGYALAYSPNPSFHRTPGQRLCFFGSASSRRR